jgi:hypothetical protein
MVVILSHVMTINAMDPRLFPLLASDVRREYCAAR